MPKLKTNRAAAKRFKIRKSGKVVAKRCNARHLFTFSKNRDRTRRLRGTFTLAAPEAHRVKRELMPTG